MQAVSSAPTAPAPALIVVERLGAAPPRAVVDERALAALPAAARVLAFGDDAALLAAGHRARHPGARWWVAPLPNEAGLPQAVAGGDGITPLPSADDAARPDGVELLVLGSAFAVLPGAAAWLRRVSDAVCAPGARLVALLDNAASARRIAQALQADLTPDDPRADAAPRADAPASFYKRLMDAGWMPGLLAHEPCEPAGEDAARALRAAAGAAGVGVGQADLTHRMHRLVVGAGRDLAALPADPGPARFTVVVPTNEERQLRANVEASPGLREVAASVVSVRRAASPADAVAQARPHVATDWLLLAHQDVYFPSGFGAQLNAVLAAVPADERSRTVIGFVGIGVDRATRQPVQAGHVIDRVHRADFAASDTALSIDELAIVLPRDAALAIDPALGWHLWATDLCLRLIAEQQCFARLVRLPLFHNSRTGWTLPAGFHEAAGRLLAKHPGFAPIHTLCGVIDDAFVAKSTRT